MGTDKKRPRGLKSSAAEKASKKAKENGESAELPQNAKTVLLDAEVDEGDEVGEAAALLDNALEKMEDDASEAAALLRGTVHESDRILRNWSDETPIPPRFYLTYGLALYELGRLSIDEDFGPYLEAAEERLRDGLSHIKDSKDNQQAKETQLLRVALGKVMIAQAAIQVAENDGQVPELATEALKLLSEGLQDISSVPAKTIIELADIVQNHGDLYDDIDSRSTFDLWSIEQLERVLKGEPENIRALSTLGLCHLSVANYWLDRVDEDESEDEDEDGESTAKDREKSLEEQKAYDAITTSRRYLQQVYKLLASTNSLTPQACTDLAEACLNEANMTTDDKERETLYSKAEDCIREAQRVAETQKIDYTLPEGLNLFLNGNDA